MLNKEILVVDDNFSTLKQLASYLNGLYNYTLRTSGLSAVEYCSQEKPDLVLLDIEMPGMSGFETIAKLRQLPNMNTVPVIFLTSNIDSDTEIKALKSGARDFISKPVDSAILLHRISIHLELAEYETDMEKTRKQLENNIVLSFADLVESKDSNTGGHVLRTSMYLEFIGRILLNDRKFPKDLTFDSLDMMVKAAPFHDIGKIGISDVLLQKPSALTEDEYAEVKKHTVLGRNFLNSVHARLPEQKYLGVAAEMAEGHHECYDGSGYPYGRKGDAIPFSCRLLAVANVYDACLTNRIYRPPLTHDEACQVIADGCGTSFDPAVVEAFDKVKAIFRSMNQTETNVPTSSRRTFAEFRMRKRGAAKMDKQDNA
jgi:putative two-component system response regulator